MRLPYDKGKLSMLVDAGRGRKLSFFIGVLATIATVILQMLTPQVIRVTIDNVMDNLPPDKPWSAFIDMLGGRDFLHDSLWLCGLILGVLAIMTSLGVFVRRYTIIEAGEHIAQRLRNTLFTHIQNLPYEWHVKVQTGDIIQRCTSDVDTIRNFICNQFVDMIRSVILMAISLVIMFQMDWIMALASLLLVPVIFVSSLVFFRAIAKHFTKADEAEGALQATAQENFTGVRVVRAFGRERYEVAKFKQKNAAYVAEWIKTSDLQAIFWGMGDMICGIQMAIVMLVGVLRCAGGELSPGTFFAFYTYSSMMIWPVRVFGRMLAEMSKASVSAGRIREILSTEPETDAESSITPPIKGEITFDHVTFAYGEAPPVLRDLSFTIKAGETLAILGGTGSGKSTLVHLLSRLYDVPEGSGTIFIDGHPINTIAREHLRKNVGLVLQEPFLYSKTIGENILVSEQSVSQELLHHVSGIAHVHDAIVSFGDGYDTVVGERGVTLSGGQKQRVAIARMLVGNTPIKIFDDSLSAVDTETDARIRKALKTMESSATTIIISHRTSTLMQADRIMVLRDGAIEEIGTHDELMASGGSYRRVFDLQGSIEEEMKEDVTL